MRAAAEVQRLRLEHALRKSDLTLRKIDEGTATSIGAAFFPSLVQNLAEALQTKYAFVISNSCPGPACTGPICIAA